MFFNLIYLLLASSFTWLLFHSLIIKRLSNNKDQLEKRTQNVGYKPRPKPLLLRGKPTRILLSIPRPMTLDKDPSKTKSNLPLMRCSSTKSKSFKLAPILQTSALPQIFGSLLQDSNFSFYCKKPSLAREREWWWISSLFSFAGTVASSLAIWLAK